MPTWHPDRTPLLGATSMTDMTYLVCGGWCNIRVRTQDDPPAQNSSIVVPIGAEERAALAAGWSFSTSLLVSYGGKRVPLCPECTEYLHELGSRGVIWVR